MKAVLRSSLLFTFSWNVTSVTGEVHAVAFVNRRGKEPDRCAGCIIR